MKYSLVTGALIGAFSTSILAANPVPPETLLAIFAPIQIGHINPDLKIKQQLKGPCFADSAAISDRADAWRCTAGNSIYDPCFGEGNKLVCLTSPWAREANEFTNTKPLPSNNKPEIFKPGHGMPWALELANGERCTLLTGATGSLAGMRANYACGKNGLVYGDIDKTHPQWLVFYQADDDKIIKQTQVTTAWY